MADKVLCDGPVDYTGQGANGFGCRILAFAIFEVIFFLEWTKPGNGQPEMSPYLDEPSCMFRGQLQACGEEYVIWNGRHPDVLYDAV